MRNLDETESVFCMIRKYGLLLILLFSLVDLKSQSKKEKIDILNEDADFFMEEHDYERAYGCYNRLIDLDPKNPYYKFKKGVCALMLPAHKTEAIGLLEFVREEEPNEPIVKFYLGRAYHINYRFDDAIRVFNEVIESNAHDTLKREANHYIKNSEFGKTMTRHSVEGKISKLGPPVNSDEADEYVPIISTDESVLMFTYRGPKSTGGLMDEKFKPDADGGVYYEDIFTAKRVSDSLWGEPMGIIQLNTKHHDASIALSPDGQTLYLFMSTQKDKGDIYTSDLVGEVWSKPERLKGDVNTRYWEGSCSITADGRYLYFASERPGGFGGRDIYIAEKLSNGEWGKVRNAGPAINTKYNEDSPFIHPDGITLFFSSEGHNSIGGYDIFYTMRKDNDWLVPINMGYPLNTTDDDRYYVINANGDKGYFSSNRVWQDSSGKGSHDIFMVTPGIFGDRPVLAMVKGFILGNDQPLEAQITILKKSTGETIGPMHSNAKTGKYLLALSPGENYTFKISAPTYPDYSEDLDIEKLDKYIEINKDFHLAKDGYVDPHLDTMKSMNQLLGKDSLKTTVTPTVTTVTKVDSVPAVTSTNANPCDEFRKIDFSALKGKSLNDPKVYQLLLDIGKKVSCEGMVFKVQIGAYRHPENYKWDHLKEFGKPEEVAYPDGITRFTQGNFSDIFNAEQQRQKAIAKGQKDAWITGWINGKRYTLEELIMVDFYNKNISQFMENLELLREYMVVK